ncbi:uncharacterized protein BX664DRAFT_333500 [Halteromyces radiatus]|uniref:uncharacterized protein n=1 Tax=Halteromyces radiatus TaxID=101107 RepID=UPI002220948E|nr:uncharacterized protein BX664DRAFT_333500 [Halteromyces radiatus]KAI8089622.1 hypothetical protein BX664DRAFT_333500 [Halteromyces radiatus]
MTLYLRSTLEKFSSTTTSSTTRLMIDEGTITLDIIDMCSPFLYTTKQYSSMRIILAEYMDTLQRILIVAEEKSSFTSSKADQLICLSNIMQALLQQMAHEQRKASKCKRQVLHFCYYQAYLLDCLDWPSLEKTYKLLCNSLPNDNDYTCPICLCLLNNPMAFDTCHHRFCRSCIDDFFSNGQPYSKSMYPIRADQQNDGLHCPVCRASVMKSQVHLDKALNGFIKTYFPVYIPWWKRAAKSSKQILSALCVAWCTSASAYQFDDSGVQSQIFIPVWY